MKSILYSGGSVITGDDIADAVLDYANELARHDSSDTLDIPTVNESGMSGRTKLLLGPASQFVVATSDSTGVEPIDAALVARILELTSHLQVPRPVASTTTTDYPDIDDITEAADPPLAEA